MNNKIYIFEELFDSEEIEAFIKCIERMFRNSWEYKIWLSFTDRSICAASQKTSMEDNFKIEAHHYNRTLYDWCDIIVNKMIDNNLMVNSCYICQILSDVHLNRCVSWLPLSKSYHDQLHALKKIYPDGEEIFMEKYPNAIDYLYTGDIIKADKIINEHIDILKTISGKED